MKYEDYGFNKLYYTTHTIRKKGNRAQLLIWPTTETNRLKTNSNRTKFPRLEKRCNPYKFIYQNSPLWVFLTIIPQEAPQIFCGERRGKISPSDTPIQKQNVSEM